MPIGTIAMAQLCGYGPLPIDRMVGDPNNGQPLVTRGTGDPQPCWQWSATGSDRDEWHNNCAQARNLVWMIVLGFIRM